MQSDVSWSLSLSLSSVFVVASSKARDGSCRTFDAPFSLLHASRVPLHLAIHLTSLESLLIFAEDQAQQRDMMATLRGRPARESNHHHHHDPPPPQVAKY